MARLCMIISFEGIFNGFWTERAGERGNIIIVRCEYEQDK